MSLMTTLETVEAPGTLHALLRLGLDCLRTIERDERYEVCMRGWHVPGEAQGDACRVCLAGSWLAGLGVPPDGHATSAVVQVPGKGGMELPGEVSSAMIALDSLCDGYVYGAWLVRAEQGHGVVDEAGEQRGDAMSRDVRLYEDSPAGWWDDMEQLHQDLVREGM